MPQKKVRMKDIALMAGVSIGTVDRVIHNRGEVAEITERKIRQILEETNYSPNVMAQVLKSRRRFHLVSLLPNPTQDNSFWEKHPIGMQRAVDELYPFPVTLSQITFDLLSEKDFQEKTGTVLDLKPDGVLLAPIFENESVSFCSLLSDGNIPFVFVDGYIENTDYLAYVGEDTFKSGRVAGQLADMITPDEKDILVVNIARNLQNVHHLNSRTNGFLDYFNDTGSNQGRKFTVSIPEPSSDCVRRELDKVFIKNQGIGSIFITGSKSHLIAAYMKENGLNSINLIGYDLLDRNVEFVKSGITRFLIGQRPEEQTYKGIKKLFEFLSLNRIPDKTEYLPVDIVTSENVDFLLK